MPDGSLIPNSTQIHNVVLDVLAPFMREGERAVFLYLYRRTFGFNREEDSISLEQFEEGIVTGTGKRLDYGCGVKRRVIIDALGFLIASGLVHRVEGGLGRTHVSRYRMNIKECPLIDTLRELMERNADRLEIVQILHQYRKVAKSAPNKYQSIEKSDTSINSADNTPFMNGAESAPKETKKGARNDAEKVQKSNPQSNREKQKETTPPLSPSPEESPPGKPAPVSEKVDRWLEWFNTAIVPHGAQPFNPEHVTPKLIAKINKAIHAKDSKKFWRGVADEVAQSSFLQGKVKPPPGKRRFRMTAAWLLSLHHELGVENYALVAPGNWRNDTPRGDDEPLEVTL